MKTLKIKEAIIKAKELAETKLAKNENADEFVEIGNAGYFRMYVTAAKTIHDRSPSTFHENPRDVCMLVLEGEIEFTFERGKRTIVKAGECFTLPKHVNHHCVFKKLTIAIEGVHEKGL